MISHSKHAQAHSCRVLVLGAGVSGLTTAVCLSRRGFQVTVVAENYAPRVTSTVAGALWEWPPAVCGHHHDPLSLARSKAWCEISYEIFAELSVDPATGVYMRPVTFYFSKPVSEDPFQTQKMHELRRKVREFRHDRNLIAERAVNPGLGLQDAYTHLAPMIDTDVYLKWLLREAGRYGCRLFQKRVSGALRAQEDDLLREYDVDAIVNCTGLGAKEICEESVYPLRGALVRVRNDGRRIPRVTQAHCISSDGNGDGRGFLFILPRGEDTLLLGGIAEPDEWNLDVGLDNYEPIRAMYQRCLDFLPILRDAEIDASEPVRVGLRPLRRTNVRLEPEAGTRTIHNYGHGGSGITFSWGCAMEVVGQVTDMVAAGRAISR